MEELFENSVLEDLFNVRTDGFESLYERKYRDKKAMNFKSKIEDILNGLIDDENKINNIIENFEELFLEESNYWNFAYYKLGILDGINISQEIKQELKYRKK